MSQNNWGWQGPQEVSSLIPSRNSDQVLSPLVLKTSEDWTAQPLWSTCCTACMSQPLLLQLMPVATCPPSPHWGAWLSLDDPSYALEGLLGALKASLLQAELAQLPLHVLTGEVLQPSPPWRSSTSSLPFVHALPGLCGPKLDTLP